MMHAESDLHTEVKYLGGETRVKPAVNATLSRALSGVTMVTMAIGTHSRK